MFDLSLCPEVWSFSSAPETACRAGSGGAGTHLVPRWPLRPCQVVPLIFHRAVHRSGDLDESFPAVKLPARRFLRRFLPRGVQFLACCR
jgi:hypothetical protein